MYANTSYYTILYTGNVLEGGYMNFRAQLYTLARLSRRAANRQLFLSNSSEMADAGCAFNGHPNAVLLMREN